MRLDLRGPVCDYRAARKRAFPQPRKVGMTGNHHHRDVEALLASYPRKRPPLTAAHEKVYVEEYRRNRLAKTGLCAVVGRLETWMHRTVAEGGPVSRVLELGAGTLNHLPYEPSTDVYDAIEPFSELWQDSPLRSRTRKIFADIAEVPVEEKYDKIVAVAVLEHLTDLPAVVASCALHLGENGHLGISIPSDGLFWHLGWRCVTGVAYWMRTGLDYAVVMRHEHVNNEAEILAILRYFFAEIRVKRFPLPPKHLSFYTAVDAARPEINRCIEFAYAR
jgi:SAM-dependent methyltransferase